MRDSARLIVLPLISSRIWPRLSAALGSIRLFSPVPGGRAEVPARPARRGRAEAQEKKVQRGREQGFHGYQSEYTSLIVFSLGLIFPGVASPLPSRIFAPLMRT